ncbi:MAG: AAA family ATPase [Candidatus Altiarchaeales archaeon]|nr:AAA family ATPase [Candidatus Altiarchaeales archaeon]MBD3415715.1 AAA family ATPase [Candidatus Altiarchaeales archaeon]
MADSIPTGIKGLDRILGGGLKPSSSCLITGAPGTGKSVLCLQYIIEGARQYNEPGIYITVEEHASDMRDYANSLGMDFSDLEENGLVTLLEQPILKGSVLSAEFISKMVEEKGIKRMVLDSLTLFKYMHQDNPMSLRSNLLKFMVRMRELNVTLLVTSERNTTSVDNVEYTHTDYLFNGIIFLFKPRLKSAFERCLTISKMRGVDHSLKIHPFAIKTGGIILQPDATSFALGGDDQ